MMGPKKTESRRARVLIVDDHPIVRRGLAQLLGQEADLVVCGEAEDAYGALEAIKKLTPDIVIVDLLLKESSGIGLIKDIKIRWPKLPVLVLTMYDESSYAERALRSGARGFLPKAEAASKVVEGIRQLLGGGVYVSDRIASRMLGKLVGGGPQAEAFPVDRLSDREFQVFELIGQGLETREIAKRLHLSPKTVDAHRAHIKTKLDVDSATGLLKYAVQWTQFERGG